MLNKVMLIGRLTADPIGRITQNGDQVATFSLAVDRVFKTQDGSKKDSVDFFNIVVWRNLAETASRYLKKGKLIYVEGRLQNRSYETSAGEKRYITEVVASNFIFLDKKESTTIQPIESTKEVDEILESVFKDDEDIGGF